MRRVGVIGLGFVGATFAYALLNQSLVDEIYIYDINKDLMLAQKNDLEQGSALLKKNTKIISADLETLKACDIIVNTASAKVLSADRILELSANRKIVKNIFAHFKDYKGIIINVSNPCDIITYLIKEETNLPDKQIIGSGTLLDSIRLKMTLAEIYNVPPKNVEALVVGEHGQSQVLVYSNCKFYGQNFYSYLKTLDYKFKKEEVDKAVIKAGSNIFSVKARTEYGIGSCLCYIIEQIYTDSKMVLPLSTPYTYDNKLIYISKLVKIGRQGYIEDVAMTLNDYEKEAFNESCQKISSIIYLK